MRNIIQTQTRFILGRLASWTFLVGLLNLVAYPGHLEAVDVVIDAGKTYQTIEGFGTCLIGWEEPFRRLYRTENFQKIYVDEMGCSLLRVNLWGPTFEKPTEDWTKISFEQFDMQSSDGRPQIFVDFDRGLRKLNPNIKTLGTVWSPPSWMKVNRSITDKQSGAVKASGYGAIDNRVDPKYFKHFCKWVVEYVKLHDRQGVGFYAISPGNEVQFTQSFESCVWDAKDYVAIIVMLREMLDQAGFRQVKIFGPETMTDHMYEGGTGSYVKAILENPQALASLGAFATHGYQDGVVGEFSANSSRKFWDVIKNTGKPFWITEGGTGDHDWPQPIRNGIGNAIHNALVGGNCSAFVPWQITERQKSIHGLMVMDKFTKKSYTAMHYFKFIRPGATRIDASPAFEDVQIGAFFHPISKQLTVIAINSSNAIQEVKLNLKGLSNIKSFDIVRTSNSENLAALPPVASSNNAANFSMPAQSIVTLIARSREQE